MVTGTVIGWNFASVKVALNPVSVARGNEQGVLQLGPIDVTTSAPGGTESNCTVTGSGADLNASMENELQPARLKPAAAKTITLRMGISVTFAASRHPRATIGASFI